MAKSWEEIKKEREEKIRSFSNPVQNNANKLRSEGFWLQSKSPTKKMGRYKKREVMLNLI